MHENLSRQHDVPAGSERAFGLVMAVFFALVAAAPLRHGLPVRWWSAGLAAGFGVLALVWRAPLRPLNLAWHRFGLLLNRVTSPIIMGLVFYVAVVPVGLVMRAFGKDPLRLRRGPEARSYWIPRSSDTAARGSMKQQF